MATSGNYGQPGSRQELDLGGGVPSPALYQPQFDRVTAGFNVGADGFGGSTHVQGSLQRIVEFVGLCVCSLLSAGVFGWLCQVAQIDGLALFTASTVAGVITFLAGVLFLSPRRRSGIHARKGKS